MAIVSVPKDGGEQLTLKAFELATLTAELLATEDEKAEVVGEFNDRIKALKKGIKKCSAEIEGQRPRERKGE